MNTQRILTGTNKGFDLEMLLESFKEDLRRWRETVLEYACEKFEQDKDLAVLSYGESKLVRNKTVKMKREGRSWRIVELW